MEKNENNLERSFKLFARSFFCFVLFQVSQIVHKRWRKTFVATEIAARENVRAQQDDPQSPEEQSNVKALETFKTDRANTVFLINVKDHFLFTVRQSCLHFYDEFARVAKDIGEREKCHPVCLPDLTIFIIFILRFFSNSQNEGEGFGSRMEMLL